MASCPGLAINAKDMQVLTRERERTTAVWEQFWISQIFSGAALHTRLDESGAIPQHAPFRLPSAFVVPPIRIIRLFGGQSKIAQTASVPSACDTAFVPLLGGKCSFVSSRVLWLN